MMGRKPRSTRVVSEDSWVLEGDSSAGASSADEELLHSRTSHRNSASPQHLSPARKNLRQSVTIPATSSPSGPEFVMPSMRDDLSAKPYKRLQPNQEKTNTRKAAADSAGNRAYFRPRVDASHNDRWDLDVITKPAVRVLLHTSTYLLSILSHILHVLKPVIAYGLAGWFLILLLRYFFASTMFRTLAPICQLPGISYLNLRFCTMYQTQNGGVEFDQLMTVQSAFEDVLSSSAGGAGLPLDMKRSEASIRDLKHVVQYSGLPSRNELVFEFTGFIETARQAAADLTHFNSRTGRAVDHVLSTNRWTLQVIDGIAEQEASRGSLSRFLQDSMPAPFQSTRITEDLLFHQYLRHTRAIEEQISELILEAHALLGILQNLDDRLDVIHSITTRDGISIKGDRDELLTQLWTVLGGNRASLQKQNEQLQLLKQVSIYRKTAWDHVSGTILKLQSIAAGLDDLRERVSAPDVLGPRADVPLRTHIEPSRLE